MSFILGLLLVLLLLAVIACGLWLLALRGNPTNRDFYGFSDYRYAHRGLHNAEREIPENSIRAFRLAANNGYGAELDVHLSKDKRLVVMHDENLQRMTGLDANICDVTSQTLDTLRLSDTREKVPYLEEILPFFDDKAPLIIELKTNGKNYVKLTRRVCKLLDRFPNVAYCIESFDPRVLIWLKKNRPDILRGQLSQNFLKDRAGTSWPLAFAMTNLLANFFAQPDFVAYRYEDRSTLALRLCKKLWHVQEVSWTIHDQAQADRVLGEGCPIIFEGFAAK